MFGQVNSICRGLGDKNRCFLFSVYLLSSCHVPRSVFDPGVCVGSAGGRDTHQ